MQVLFIITREANFLHRRIKKRIGLIKLTHVSYDANIGCFMAREKGTIPQTQGLVCQLRDSSPPYYNPMESDGVFPILLPGVKVSRRDIGGWDCHHNLLYNGTTSAVDKLPAMC